MNTVKFILSLLVLLSVFSIELNAQDIIIKVNGEAIEAKVAEITTDNVRYKKASNPNGPFYTILSTDIFMIKYDNGDKDLFEKNPSTGTVSIKNIAAQKPEQAVKPDKSAKEEKTPSSGNANSTVEKIRQLRKQLNDGQITQKEYDKKLSSILEGTN